MKNPSVATSVIFLLLSSTTASMLLDYASLQTSVGMAALPMIFFLFYGALSLAHLYSIFIATKENKE